MESNKNRRSRMGFLIDPQHQLRFAFYLIGGGVTALMLVCLYILVTLERSMQEILTRAQVETEVSDILIERVGNAELNVTAISLTLLGLSIFVGVKLSHRIYGPIVQIRKHVANLIQGDYKSRIHLRDHDQFVELGDDLNQLAAKLDQNT